MQVSVGTSFQVLHVDSGTPLAKSFAVLSTPTQAKPTPQDQHSMTAASQASLAVALGCVGSACIVQSFTSIECEEVFNSKESLGTLGIC